MTDKVEHQTVLLDEAITALVARPEGCYVDGTFGRGGHTQAILSRLSDSGAVMAIDKDPAAQDCAEQTFGDDSRFEFVRGSFAEQIGRAHV